MFGGFHIEMAAFKTIGNLLDSNGWSGTLVEANCATPGTADSFLRITHVTRTRRAHQDRGKQLESSSAESLLGLLQ